MKSSSLFWNFSPIGSRPKTPSPYSTALRLSIGTVVLKLCSYTTASFMLSPSLRPNAKYESQRSQLLYVSVQGQVSVERTLGTLKRYIDRFADSIFSNWIIYIGLAFMVYARCRTNPPGSPFFYLFTPGKQPPAESWPLPLIQCWLLKEGSMQHPFLIREIFTTAHCHARTFSHHLAAY